MLRTPMKLALEATVFTAVLAWEVYKRTPFRPKTQGSVPAEVTLDEETPETDGHGHRMHDITWYIFPDDIVDEDGDKITLTIENRASDYCPECIALSDYVAFNVDYVVSKVEGVRQELSSE